jgi:hypothetical protein
MNMLFLPFLLTTAGQSTIPTPSIVITSELVCTVQHAIRWRAAAWQPWMCVRVSDAVNAAAKATDLRSDTLLAIAINESDLRPWAAHWHRAWTFLPGDQYYANAVGPGAVGDLGLMGTRCKLGPDMLCSNGLLKGWKYPAAMQIENNIMLGARILASAGKRGYNAGVGYWDRIDVIRAALGGEVRKTKSVRVRELIRQITEALRAERTS